MVRISNLFFEARQTAGSHDNNQNPLMVKKCLHVVGLASEQIKSHNREQPQAISQVPKTQVRQ